MKILVLIMALVSIDAFAVNKKASEAKAIALAARETKISIESVRFLIRDAYHGGKTAIVVANNCLALKALENDGYVLTVKPDGCTGGNCGCEVDWGK